MKRFFLVLTVFTVIFLMVSCGDDSSSKRNNMMLGGNDGNSSGSCETVDGATWSSLSSGRMDWYEANEYCESLNECGYSDWHLPSISELRTLIKNCDGAEADGSCGLSESCRDWECLFDDYDCWCDCRKDNGGYYSRLGDDDKVSLWSSTGLEDSGYAWFVPFGGACDEYDVGDYFEKDYSRNNRVRCVRSGSYNDNDDYGDDDYGDDDYGDDDYSDSSYESGSYSCAEIYDCQVNSCSSSDQECQQNCFNKGTSSAQSTASTMFQCWNSYCGDDSASNTCLDDYCYDETHDCNLYTKTGCVGLNDCLNNCGSDEDCQESCFNAASSEGQNRFVDFYNCSQSYCSEYTQQEYVDCMYSYCSNEIYKCGFRD